MICLVRKFGVFAGILVIGLCGCTSSQLSSAFVKPAKYSIYNCKQIADAGLAQASRERELKALMDKAGQGAGGQIAIAVAYRSEYLAVQGELRELEAAAVEKNCKMPWSPISERAVQ